MNHLSQITSFHLFIRQSCFWLHHWTRWRESFYRANGLYLCLTSNSLTHHSSWRSVGFLFPRSKMRPVQLVEFVHVLFHQVILQSKRWNLATVGPHKEQSQPHTAVQIINLLIWVSLTVSTVETPWIKTAMYSFKNSKWSCQYYVDNWHPVIISGAVKIYWNIQKSY